jgi:hypothetical protein
VGYVIFVIIKNNQRKVIRGGKKEMKLCLITPFSELYLSEVGDMYFALTKQLRENLTYYNFFKDKKDRGKEIIVDNNVHEKEELDFEEHVKLAIDVGTIIIIPDVMRNKKKTLEYYHYFMDKFYPLLLKNNIKIMAVPQGNTIGEINECFDEFNNDERISFIGQSFDLEPTIFTHERSYQNQSLNRICIVTDWCNKGLKKKIHLLGSNNLDELYLLSKFKGVYSTDGKIFSRLALANVEINRENWELVEKDRNVKMEFEKCFTYQQANLFLRNVKFFKGVLDDN